MRRSLPALRWKALWKCLPSPPHEIYGTASIGAIRSFFQTIVVFSTAMAPIVFGLLLDAGIGFSAILYGCAGVMVLGILWSWQIVNEQRWRGKK